jgi:hypothetical protein
VRAFARDLSERTGVSIEVSYDSGPRWHLEWSDGPSRDAVIKAATKTDLAGAVIVTHRHYSTRAVALGSIRLAASTTTYGHSTAETRTWRIEETLEEVDYPDRAADAREEHMVNRVLVEATPEGWKWTDRDLVVALIGRKGLGWLLADADPGVASPAEILTARYATTGAEVIQWNRHAHPMPAADAVRAALADPDLGAVGSVALLRLLRQLREDRQRAEDLAVAVAQRAGVPLWEIADALGVDKVRVSGAQHQDTEHTLTGTRKDDG